MKMLNKMEKLTSFWKLNKKVYFYWRKPFSSVVRNLKKKIFFWWNSENINESDENNKNAVFNSCWGLVKKFFFDEII